MPENYNPIPLAVRLTLIAFFFTLCCGIAFLIKSYDDYYKRVEQRKANAALKQPVQEKDNVRSQETSCD